MGAPDISWAAAALRGGTLLYLPLPGTPAAQGQHRGTGDVCKVLEIRIDGLSRREGQQVEPSLEPSGDWAVEGKARTLIGHPRGTCLSNSF